MDLISLSASVGTGDDGFRANVDELEAICTSGGDGGRAMLAGGGDNGRGRLAGGGDGGRGRLVGGGEGGRGRLACDKVNCCTKRGEIGLGKAAFVDVCAWEWVCAWACNKSCRVTIWTSCSTSPNGGPPGISADAENGHKVG